MPDTEHRGISNEGVESNVFTKHAILISNLFNSLFILACWLHNPHFIMCKINMKAYYQWQWRDLRVHRQSEVGLYSETSLSGYQDTTG